MSAVWSNPIIWGYKHGYTVAEIAEGLGVPQARVRGDIVAYEERLTEGQVALRQSADVLGKNPHVQKLGYWQRQRQGARAALAAIEEQRLIEQEERYGR